MRRWKWEWARYRLRGARRQRTLLKCKATGWWVCVFDATMVDRSVCCKRLDWWGRCSWRRWSGPGRQCCRWSQRWPESADQSNSRVERTEAKQTSARYLCERINITHLVELPSILTWIEDNHEEIEQQRICAHHDQRHNMKDESLSSIR